MGNIKIYRELFKDKECNKKLLSMILPIAFQQFMLALVSASDAIMLGSLSQDSMSAVSLATQITFVENLFLAAMTIGLSMLAAQYWGKNDVGAVERIFAYVLKITLVISTIFFLTTAICPVFLMKLFTNDMVLISDGSGYLRAVSFSYLLTGISQIYLCIMKNCGKAGKASLISSVSVILNIVFNAILIFGFFGAPRLEIAGAAFATVIARLIEVMWCFAELKRNGRVHIKIHNLVHNDVKLRSDFWKYTTPVLGNEMVWGVGFTMYSVIMGHLGSDAVAANSIANIVKNLVACFCLGLGSGGGIIVGNMLGAGKLEKAKEQGKKLCILAILSGVTSGLFLLAISPFILHFANLTPTANAYLKGMLIMCSYYMIGKSVNGTTIAGIFCAGGDSKFGFLCDTITMWCMTVPLGFLAAFALRVPVLVVYFIVNLDEIVKLPAVYKHYKKYFWVKDLTKENQS